MCVCEGGDLHGGGCGRSAGDMVSTQVRAAGGREPEHLQGLELADQRDSPCVG